MPWEQVPKKFAAGKLHSGGPGGPVVKSRDQMIAIMLSEKRKGTHEEGASVHGRGKHGSRVLKP